MLLTIVPIDGTVGVDKKFIINLDLADCNIPNNIHALQWYENEGELEFVDNPDRTKPQNQIIYEIPLWADNAIVKFNQAIADEIAAQEAALLAEQEAKNNQPETTGTQTL